MARLANDRALGRRAVARALAARALGFTVALGALVLGPATGCKPKPAVLPPGSVLRLAFAQNMLAFDVALGERATRDVRVAGHERDNATLAIVSIDGPATAELLPAEPAGPNSDPLRAGVRLTVQGREVGEGLGRVVVTTGLAPPKAPKQLVVYYTWKVSGQASGSRSRSSP
jgi:hypothetical protein